MCLYFNNACYSNIVFIYFTAQPLTALSPPINRESIEDIFIEPITIADAYTSLVTELGYVLKTADLSMLKVSLYNQSRTPSGVKLEKHLQKSIEAAKSSEDLLAAFGRSSSCNWLDIRLLNTLARATRSPTALKLMKTYETLLYSKNLTEALPKFSKPRLKYTTAVSMKLDVSEDKITIGDMVKYQWNIEEVILNLGRGVLKLKHVKKGCLEIQFSIPVHLTFHAYKTALHNHHKIHLLRVMYIKLGNLPLIIDPWLTEVAASSKLQRQMFYNYSGE